MTLWGWWRVLGGRPVMLHDEEGRLISTRILRNIGVEEGCQYVLRGLMVPKFQSFDEMRNALVSIINSKQYTSYHFTEWLATLFVVVLGIIDLSSHNLAVLIIFVLCFLLRSVSLNYDDYVRQY